MRAGVIQRVLGRLLWFAVASLAVPLFVSIWFDDGVWWCFAAPAGLAAILGAGFNNLPSAKAAPSDSMRRREGFVAVVMGWLVLVLFTAFAFALSGRFPSFAHAFFESMSGFTTTGATVATDIEALPESILFMRSFAHWIGGMGIIVLSVAILPELAVGGMQLFSAEASGFEADKLAPRIAQTARRLWTLYLGITAVLAALLAFGGMTLFDALNHSMATIATGGFSTKNASVAFFDSLYIEVVIIVFMFVSGISFTLQFRALQGKPVRLFRSAEVRLYTLITLAAIAAVTLNLYLEDEYTSLGQTLRYSAFQVVSILTTTGFGTYDFDAWPDFSRGLLVLLMLIGGCAGSTAGGSKVVRLHVVLKHAGAQLRRLVRPRLVDPLFLGDREVSSDTTEGVLGFYLLYIAAIVVGSLAMYALGLDLVSGSTAAISAMNSIGPGLGTVGAAEPFTDVPGLGLYLLSFGMLLGRLEIYTLLVLFIPHFWRRG